MENPAVASAGCHHFCGRQNSQSDRVRIRPREHEADPPPLLDFKNHGQVEMELCAQVNCLLGDNGTGKTNVLDAVHYLGNAKGYFNPIDSRTSVTVRPPFSWRAPLRWKTRGRGGADRVRAVAKGQKKLLKRNGKAYAKLADHVGRYPVVMIAPSDSVLVLDGSEVRRKWMDAVISQATVPTSTG